MTQVAEQSTDTTATILADGSEHYKRSATVFAVEVEFAISKAGSTNNPRELLLGETRRYCPGFVGSSVLRGISIEDERRIPQFASVIGTSPDSGHWENTVKEYWANYLIHIPFAEIRNDPKRPLDLKFIGGRKLNASYTLRNGKIYPENLNDYILYELMHKEVEAHALYNPQGKKTVSIDPTDFNTIGDIKYFCIDDSLEEQRREKAQTQKRHVSVALAGLITDEANTDKLKLIVSLTSKNISSIGALTIDRNSALDEINDLARDEPNKFLKIVNDKNLSEKSTAKQFVDAGIMTMQGREYFLDDNLIGDISDVIKFMRSPSSGSTMDRLKQRLAAYKTLI